MHVEMYKKLLVKLFTSKIYLNNMYIKLYTYQQWNQKQYMIRYQKQDSK